MRSVRIYLHLEKQGQETQMLQLYIQVAVRSLFPVACRKYIKKKVLKTSADMELLATLLVDNSSVMW